MNLMEVHNENQLRTRHRECHLVCPGRQNSKHPKANLQGVQTLPKQVGHSKQARSVLAQNYFPGRSSEVWGL